MNKNLDTLLFDKAICIENFMILNETRNGNLIGTNFTTLATFQVLFFASVHFVSIYARTLSHPVLINVVINLGS